MWRAEASLPQDVIWPVPERYAVAIFAGFVCDRQRELSGAERRIVQRAVDSRRNQFATGRHLARLALDAFGTHTDTIGRDAYRRPIWPEGYVGSITHTEQIALAGVTARRSMLGLGLDIERTGRVGEELHERLFTPRERSHLATLDLTDPWTLAFSAKEAAYKAVNPTTDEFVPFQDAEIAIDVASARFSVRYTGPHAPTRVLDAGTGYFGHLSDHVATIFIIPRDVVG